MEDSATALLPQAYRDAEANLQTLLANQILPADSSGQQRLMGDLKVSVSKGYDLQTWKPDASQDKFQITLQSPDLVSSEKADVICKTTLDALNKIDAVSNNTIVVSPEDYTNQVKEKLATLLNEVKKAHVPGKHIDLADVDLTKWKGFDTSYSNNQFAAHAIQLVEGPTKTSIRINIPTNPDNREEAMETAKKVAQNLNQRLPDIKTNMIKRILEKNYATPRSANDPNWKAEWTKQMESHHFEVTTQQQANWTSVFIDIQSPAQKMAQATPGAPLDPNLGNSNMLASVDEKHRLKLAARTTLFEGEGLKKPSSIFTEVAGAPDMENVLGKALHYLTMVRPDLTEAKEALLKENVFREEQWNKAPGQQDDYKRSVHAGIDPDHPDRLKITLTMPKGKADEVAQAIAALDPKSMAIGASQITAAAGHPLPHKTIDAGMDQLSQLLAGLSGAKSAPAAPMSTKADPVYLNTMADSIIADMGKPENMAVTGASAQTQVGKVVPIPGLSPGSPLGEVASSITAASAMAGVTAIR